MDDFKTACDLMQKQLGHDAPISLATCKDSMVSVRNVDGYYKDGFIYVVTYTASHKMRQISANSNVAFCTSYNPNRPFYEGLLEGFGTGENMGHPQKAENAQLRNELKEVFIGFYDRHVNEEDPQTCILKIKITRAVIFDGKFKFAIDYENRTAEKSDCKI